MLQHGRNLRILQALGKQKSTCEPIIWFCFKYWDDTVYYNISIFQHGKQNRVWIWVRGMIFIELQQYQHFEDYVLTITENGKESNSFQIFPCKLFLIWTEHNIRNKAQLSKIILPHELCMMRLGHCSPHF